MGLLDRITNAILPQQKNSLRGNDFLKNGTRNIPLIPTWSDVLLDNKDLYKGYAYAAIQKRSNKVAKLARGNLRTWVNTEMQDKFRKYGITPQHPYLRIIENSTVFSEKKFWKDISIYLDLLGVYYLGVVRSRVELPQEDGEKEERFGDVKEFILINPYNIQRVVNSKGEVAGYIERNSVGMTREWATWQIIEMRELNPTKDDQNFSMAEASKESLYTISQATDYARQSMNGNLNAPGIITTDIHLNDEDFANFVSRVKNTGRGEPIFGNGSGAMTWQPMQIDLDQAALVNIKSGSRDEFFAVSGTSKTILGIEESGTTRETARTQTELFLSDVAEPRLEDIIDFLNLDYKTKYPVNYKKYGYLIEVISSTARDYDTDIKAVQLKREQYQLAQDISDMGYTFDSAIQYATGEIDLNQIEAITVDYNYEEEQEVVPEENPQEETSEAEQIDPSAETEQTETQAENTIIENEDGDLIFDEDDKENWDGWIGAVVRPINVTDRLRKVGKLDALYTGPIKDYSNTPAQVNPHFTLMYGLRDDPNEIRDLIDGAVKGLREVIVKEIGHFEVNDNYNVLVAKLERTPELLKARKNLEHFPFYTEYDYFNPHITLAYIKKSEDIKSFYELFQDLPKQIFDVLAIDYGGGFEDGLYKPEDSEEIVLEKVKHAHEDGVCEHCHEHDTGIETYNNDLSQDDVEIMHNAHNNFISTLRNIQREAIDNAVSKITVNSFEEEDIFTPEAKQDFTNKLKEAVKDYWWILVPLFANTLIGQRNNQFKTKYNFVFNEDIKEKVITNATKVSNNHIQTIINNILKASNKAYRSILEDVATGLIQELYDRNPEKLSAYFENKPTEKQVKKAIQTTDLLEKNRKIYEKANKMVQDGYSRSDVVKAIKNEYESISTHRAKTIASNETARAFVNSQYQADIQFLNSTGKIQNAYKELYSRSGDPCPFCKEVIKQGPIPFTEPFVELGGTVKTTINGKEAVYTASYEDIDAGVLHVNCHCGYRLILKDETNGIETAYNSLNKLDKELYGESK